MKLGRNDFPFLTVNMVVENTSNKQSTFSNQVPVMILPRVTWDEYTIPYGTIDFEVQAKCPRFPVFKKFINLFKNQKNIKFTLCNDETLTIEVNEDTSSHFSIFDKIPVSLYGKDEPYTKEQPIEVTVDQKKISNWISSLNFPTTPKLSIMIENRKNLKLFFRTRDDILAQFVISSVYSEDDLSENEDLVNPFDNL